MGLQRYYALVVYEWDEAKRLENIAKHHIDFRSIYLFEWNSASIDFDDRHDEPRWVARGFIGVVLYTVVYTERVKRIRIISMRRSTRKEAIEYVSQES